MGSGRGKARRVRSQQQGLLNVAEKIGEVGLAVREERLNGTAENAMLIQIATVPRRVINTKGQEISAPLVIKLFTTAEAAANKQYREDQAGRRLIIGRLVEFSYGPGRKGINGVYQKSELEHILRMSANDTQGRAGATMPDQAGEEDYWWVWDDGTLYAQKKMGSLGKGTAVMGAQDVPDLLRCLGRIDEYIDEFAQRIKRQMQAAVSLRDQVEKVTF